MLRNINKYLINYEQAYNHALLDPIAYWKDQAQFVKWNQFPSTILQVDDLHFHKWFPDGKINITEQCLDVHLKDRSNQIAYFIESPITNSVLI
jgi:hypothetical protein